MQKVNELWAECPNVVRTKWQTVLKPDFNFILLKKAVETDLKRISKLRSSTNLESGGFLFGQLRGLWAKNWYIDFHKLIIGVSKIGVSTTFHRT